MAVTISSPSTDASLAATWRAMGTQVVVEVAGPPDLIDRAKERIEMLEARWSRFRDESDVARMNELRGLPVFVHADTRRLVHHAVAAWDRTAGACDASVMDAVVAAGYDRSFELLDDRSWAIRPAPTVPGCGGIEVDDELGSVTLPPDAGFDPGGIGKGLAADLVAEELIEAGATGVFVSLGGDVRLAGQPTTGDGWMVDVVDHGDTARVVARLALGGGAVATSTTQRRRWRVGARSHHHVIDPRTGRPATASARTATVVAGEAWWAEAKATQLLLAAPNEWAAVVGDGAALVVDEGGSVHALGQIDRYRR